VAPGHPQNLQRHRIILDLDHLAVGQQQLNLVDPAAILVLMLQLELQDAASEIVGDALEKRGGRRHGALLHRRLGRVVAIGSRRPGAHHDDEQRQPRAKAAPGGRQVAAWFHGLDSTPGKLKPS